MEGPSNASFILYRTLWRHEIAMTSQYLEKAMIMFHNLGLQGYLDELDKIVASH